MNRRHLFGLVAAALVAPFVKPATPPRFRPRIFEMGERGPETIVESGGGFEWKDVPGYATGGWVTSPSRFMDVGYTRPYPADPYLKTPIDVVVGGVLMERIVVAGQKIAVRARRSERTFFA